MQNAIEQQEIASRFALGNPQALLQTAPEFIELLPVAAYACDAEGRILWFNQRAAEMWGRTPCVGDASERFCGSWKLYFGGRTITHAETPMADVLRTGRAVHGAEGLVERPDGSQVWATVHIDPVKDAKGELLGAINCFHDTTELHRARIDAAVHDAHTRQSLDAMQRQRRLYEAILTNTPDLAYIFDLDHTFTYANEVLLKMWGKTREEAIGKNCLELGYPAWHAAMHDREIEQVIATKRPVRGEVPYSGTFGRRIYDYIFVPVIGPDGNVEAVAGTTRDTTDQKRSEQRALAQKQILEKVATGRPLLETLDALMLFLEAQEPELRCGILLVDEDGAHFRRGSGPSLPERYHAALDGVPITPPFLGSCGEAAHRGAVVVCQDLETETRYADAWRTLLLSCGIRAARSTPVYGSNGRPLASIAMYADTPCDPTPDPALLAIATHLSAIAIGAAKDISARKRHEQHRELLINELNHRVKNTLATVQSMAMQTLRNAADTHQAGEQIEARLMALSRAHEILTRGHWHGANLDNIVREAVAPYCGSPNHFDIDGPATRVPPRHALSLAMALHELCTNAVKYGALSRDEGRVRIEWRVTDGADGKQALQLRWSEHGGPLVTRPTRRGFGSRLIERGLKQDLHGDVKLDFARAGVVCTITAPLPCTPADPAGLVEVRAHG